MNNQSSINKMISLPNKLSYGSINNVLKFAQTNDAMYRILVSLDLSQDEQFKNYGSILNLQDDLDDAGIPIDENIRKLWDKTALTNKQSDLEAIVENYKDNVIEECKLLVKQFSK